MSEVEPKHSEVPPGWAQVMAGFRAPADFWDRPSGDWGSPSATVGAARAAEDDERRRDANSAYRLGTKALRGGDLETARLWFEKASAEGHPGAAFRLTVTLLREQRQGALTVLVGAWGGGKTSTAVALLSRAALWGHGDATYLIAAADRVRTSGLGPVRGKEVFLAETRPDGAQQATLPSSGGTDSGRGHIPEDGDFYDEVRECIFMPLWAFTGTEEGNPQTSEAPLALRKGLILPSTRILAGDDHAAVAPSRDRAGEALRDVARAGAARAMRPAFHAAMAATGTETYTAIKQLVQYANPSADTTAKNSDLYGVSFIDTSATPPASITANGAIPDRVSTRLRMVEHGSDRTVPNASADDLKGDKDQRPSTRFTLSQDRVSELLAGEQLYTDRGLAIRELYQNALDACRYRAARHEYLHRTSRFATNWHGRIGFTQAIDEHGRAYLECRDNGIGMGEEELSTSFSRVGLRFPELSEFRQEKARWDACEPPVRMYPNSRFGIGVLSYFMLADEIQVTTCRMDQHGSPGPEFRMTISSPGHLAGVTRVRTHGHEPGTQVRLYLRDGQNAPSCVAVLERILGIAEYSTSASHGNREARWVPNVLEPRKLAPSSHNAIGVRGWVAHTFSNQVVWCESGGALLSDGLLVQPSVLHGVFADSQSQNALHGAVINLTRSTTPTPLSVDRKRIVGDISDEAGSLARRAARELVTTQRDLVTDHWLESLARHSPGLAKIVTRAAIEAR